MHQMQRSYLREMLNTAMVNGASREGFETFLREYSLAKSMNINMDYRTVGRSAVEQNDMDRMIFGMPVYPRGNVELLQLGVFRPWAEGYRAWKASGYALDKTPVKPFTDGWRVMFWFIMGKWASDMLLSYVAGNKRDQRGRPLKSFSAWKDTLGFEAQQPGMSIPLEIASAFADIIEELDFGDGESAATKFIKTVDRRVLATMLPWYEDANNLVEMIANTSGVRLAEGGVARVWNAMAERLGMDTYDGYETSESYRSWLGKAHHALFGTDEVEPEWMDFEHRAMFFTPSGRMGE